MFLDRECGETGIFTFSDLPGQLRAILIPLSHRKEKKPKILENLLLSFSAYCTTAAHDSRGRLCNLGEDILPTVLHLWGHCQPSVETQLVSLLRCGQCCILYIQRVGKGGALRFPTPKFPPEKLLYTTLECDL